MLRKITLTGIVGTFMVAGFIAAKEPNEPGKKSAQAKMDEEFIEIIRDDYHSQDVAKIEVLLKRGANVNAVILADGWPYGGKIPAIHYVAAFRSFEILRLLIQYGANPITLQQPGHPTTLTGALDCSRTSMTADCLDKAEYLLENFPIDINAQGVLRAMDDGATALMIAVGRTCSSGDCSQKMDARRRSLRLIRSLLTKGAKVDLKKTAGDWPVTALLIAIYNSDLEVVELLINGGAKINIPEKSSVMDRCMRASSFNPMLCDYLASKGAEFSPNLLWEVAQSGVHTNVTQQIAFLIQRKISPDFQAPESGNTALHEAALQCERGKDIFQILIAAGASCKIKNGKGQTALEIRDSCLR